MVDDDCEEPEAAVVADDDCEEPEEATVEMKLRPGHGSEQTIIVVSSADSKDKAQLVAVSAAIAAELDSTPMMVCERIVAHEGLQQLLSC